MSHNHPKNHFQNWNGIGQLIKRFSRLKGLLMWCKICWRKEMGTRRCQIVGYRLCIRRLRGVRGLRSTRGSLKRFLKLCWTLATLRRKLCKFRISVFLNRLTKKGSGIILKKSCRRKTLNLTFTRRQKVRWKRKAWFTLKISVSQPIVSRSFPGGGSKSPTWEGLKKVRILWKLKTVWTAAGRREMNRSHLCCRIMSHTHQVSSWETKANRSLWTNLKSVWVLGNYWVRRCT